MWGSMLIRSEDTDIIQMEVSVISTLLQWKEVDMWYLVV